MWDATQEHGHGLEFVLHAPVGADEVHVETLTMVAYYHAAGRNLTLDHGHTVPIGQATVRGSTCEHLLVSLPYPWGQELPTSAAQLSDNGAVGACRRRINTTSEPASSLAQTSARAAGRVALR